MKTGMTISELSAEVMRKEGKKDYIADSQSLTMTKSGELVVSGSEHGLTPNAHGQLSAFTGIPKAYYDKMLREDTGLLAENVNTWFQRKPAKRMVRTLDGNVRALLSEKYRRIDNWLIAGAALPMLSHLKVVSCNVSPDKMYIKAVNDRVQTEIKKGDVVQSGICISNSETGNGTVVVAPLVYRLVCTNGMIANTAGMRRRHVGRANDFIDVDYSVLSEATLKADDEVLVAKIRDITKATLDESRFEEIVGTMRAAQGLEVTSKNVPKVVELVGKEHNLLEAEMKAVLNNFIVDKDLSLYGLANAITRTSQESESYDRASALETVGWHVITTPEKDWAAINKAAA